MARTTTTRSPASKAAAKLESQHLADQKGARTQRFVLGIVSLCAGIPITAISAMNVDPGLLGVMVSWAGIVGVNAVHALANRRHS